MRFFLFLFDTIYFLMFVSLVRVIGFDSKRHVISDKKIKQSKNDVIAFF